MATFMIGQQLKVVVLLDTDRAGEDARDGLVKRWLTRYQDKKAEVRISDSDLSSCGGARSDKLTSEKVCLRGKVRVVTTEARTARPLGGGLVEGAPYSVTRATYDERGKLTLMELSDIGNGPGPVGVVFRRGVNSYDEQGRMTSSKWYEVGADEPSSVVVTLVFDVVFTFVVELCCWSDTVSVEPSMDLIVPNAPRPANRVCGPP